MADRLTALDATFLELEEADDSAHMHIGAVMVFDPPPAGRPPTVDELAALLEDRLGTMPRYRQRLSQRRTGGLTWPEWEPDPHFALANHLRRAALPAPGDEAALFAWAAAFFSHRLDRGRPLWELVIVEGLEGGRWALGSKTHHAMVDGVGSVDVSHLMLDAEPEPAPRPPAAAPPAAVAGHGLVHAISPVFGGAARAARGGVGAALHPRRTLERSRAALGMLVRDEVIAAPATSLNEPIGASRRYATVHADLAEARAIRTALGGTVNDVALAAVTGALRALLVARGEAPPAAGLRAMVPMNVRQASEHLAMGNKVTSLFVHLPVAETDPMRRYVATKEEAEGLKGSDQALGSATVVDLTSLAPPVLHSTLAQSLFASRLFNVTVTNVPGPPVTLYAFGSAMREVHPLVPLAAEHAVGACIVSYDGSLYFGLIADADTVPDFPVLVDGLEAALGELRELAGVAAG